MIRKMVGGLLLAVGGVLGLVLVTYGGPVFPHIVGPAVLAVIGATLLWLKGLPWRHDFGTKKPKSM
jgi:hypothetical protein